MKSLNHDTRHLSRHDSDDKQMADDKDADAFTLLDFLTAKQHKKRRWLLDNLVANRKYRRKATDWLITIVIW